MSDVIIITVFGFLVTLIAVVTPIIHLTSKITEINTTLLRFEKEYKDNHMKLEDRVSRHGEEIDELKETVIEHDVRLNNLEKE